MKSTKSRLALAGGALALGLSLAAAQAMADTRSSEKDRATMEHRASPANPVKQDEERTAAHSQPSVPHASGGSSSSPKAKALKKKKSKARKPDKSSSSAGASRPAAALSAEHQQAFKGLDLDGDGQVSKAEGAGHADFVAGFDRADRNRDGKLSAAEYGALLKRRDALAKRHAPSGSGRPGTQSASTR